MEEIPDMNNADLTHGHGMKLHWVIVDIQEDCQEIIIVTCL